MATPRLSPFVASRAEQRRHLGLALAHREVAPDAGLGLGVRPVVLGDDGHGARRAARVPGRAARYQAGSYSSKGSSRMPALSATASPSTTSPRASAGPRATAPRPRRRGRPRPRCHEERAVDVLGPRVAPDVVRDRASAPPRSRSLARSCTRWLSRPSSSPSTRAPWPPWRMRPGAIQSAAQLTRQPTVRAGPTARAICSSLSPFWSDTIVLSAARRGARTPRAAWRVLGLDGQQHQIQAVDRVAGGATRGDPRRGGAFALRS